MLKPPAPPFVVLVGRAAATLRRQKMNVGPRALLFRVILLVLAPLKTPRKHTPFCYVIRFTFHTVHIVHGVQSKKNTQLWM